MVPLGVCVAVIKDGQILLVKREDFEVWALPGGQVDSGESVAQAAVREVFEETGLEVELKRMVGIYSRLAGWNNGGSHNVSFVAEPIGGILKPQKGEVLDVQYFDPNELPKVLFWGHRQRIQDAVSGVGGGVAWSQHMTWPFDPGLKRQDIYKLRDESGLSREEFYLKHFGQSNPGDERLEVGE